MPAESGYAFGDSWSGLAKLVGEDHIEGARQGLLRLLPEASFKGRTFLDIGCGSGLDALAAARLGARHVLAIDADQKNVAAAEALLARHGGGVPWTVRCAEVFDLDPRRHGRYDIVYSWGVLHRTGSVADAVAKAASLVATGGHLAVALYRPTRLDPFWVAEKRWYAQADQGTQRLVRAVHIGLLRMRLTLAGRGVKLQSAGYDPRGRDLRRAVQDWLGRFPYESIAAAEVESLLAEQGLEMVQEFAVSRSKRPLGLLGSGCDEYVYRRPG